MAGSYLCPLSALNCRGKHHEASPAGGLGISFSVVQQWVHNIVCSTRGSAGLFPLYLLSGVVCTLHLQSQYPRECAKQQATNCHSFSEPGCWTRHTDGPVLIAHNVQGARHSGPSIPLLPARARVPIARPSGAPRPPS